MVPWSSITLVVFLRTAAPGQSILLQSYSDIAPWSFSIQQLGWLPWQCQWLYVQQFFSIVLSCIQGCGGIRYEQNDTIFEYY
jgi:hypothetical protein